MQIIPALVLSCLLVVQACNIPRDNPGLKLHSPDGQITFSLGIKNDSTSYAVVYKGTTLIENSMLGFDFAGGGLFGKDLSLQSPEIREIDENYTLVVGKNRTARNHCMEMRLPMVERSGSRRQVILVVRAFNDGLAFRYEFPGQIDHDSISIRKENTTFDLAGNPTVLALFLPHFQTSHEGLYTKVPYENIQEDSLMDVPALFRFGDIYMAITEAALVDYAGMYLVKHGGVLQSKFAPLPGNSAIMVKASLPHRSPWRVLMISDRFGDLFESNILTSLNEPGKIGDPSWIRPGKATWPWWNGTVVSDPGIVAGNNFETNKYYIDFCARNGIEYHSVVEHGNHEWYMNNGTGYMPGSRVDVTRPVEGLDMQQVCDYGASKGVGIRVWVHWEALYPQLEEAFTQYEKWGISGLMVDFMDRDDQEMVNIQNEILERAAAHHLHIQFHGAYKPTGLHRTYPNEFTREGTLNYEVNKWANTVTPDHDLNIISARLLAGATDYHLGGFRAVPVEGFEVRYEKPLMMGTRCHMLAMYVVLESYLGLVCDFPEAYEGEAGFEFISRVPTVWDETRVVDAEVSDFITMARRKNRDWYVGSVNNHQARAISVSFDFLPEGQYLAEIYSDSPGSGSNPNLIVKQSRKVSSTDQVTLQLASGGGAVMYITESR